MGSGALLNIHAILINLMNELHHLKGDLYNHLGTLMIRPELDE